MSGTAGTSPKACPAKMLMAMASARVSPGTEPRSTALSGESEVQMATCATVMVAKKTSGDGERTQATQQGTAMMADQALTRMEARMRSVSLMRSLRNPPKKVPTNPVTTTTAPK